MFYRELSIYVWRRDGKSILNFTFLVFLLLVFHISTLQFHGRNRTMKFYVNEDVLCKDSAYFGYVEPFTSL